MTRLIARYWLNKYQYVAELSNCLAIVTQDKNGEIIRVATFGNKKEGDNGRKQSKG